MDIGLLIIRLAVGLTMAAHGTQKLFGWWGGYGLSRTGAFFDQLGFRPGRMQAALVGLAETAGGILLAAGAFTPLAAALVIAVMFVAIATVHLRAGFFASSGGFEYNLLLIASAAGVAFSGPGAFSVDHALGLVWSGWTWGLVALVGGVLAGLAQVAGRSVARNGDASDQTAA